MTAFRIALLMLMGSVWFGCTTTDHDQLVYVGTYTGKGSDGIYAWRFNSTDGHLTPIGLAARTTNPSYFIIDSSYTFLYAVQETDTFDGKPGGVVSSFSINHETGALTLINQVPSLGGAPCNLSLDRTGRHLMVANYVGGNATIYPVSANGMLGEPTATVKHEGFSVDPARQNSPHAHAILTTPDNRFVAIADLGIDKVMMYPFDDRNGTLDVNRAWAITLSPGDGPRHLSFSKDGQTMYVLNELSSTVTAFSLKSSDFQAAPIQTATLLSAEFKGVNTAAELSIDPTGKYLFASNRGEESIVRFLIEPDGRLTFSSRIESGGRGPRHFEIDPTGQWLMVANQQSNNLALISLERDGGLNLAWKNVNLNSPVCVKFIPLH
jgi:6-phosphogluconolactonase